MEYLTYDNFKSFHQSELLIPKTVKVSCPITEIKKIVIPLSYDLSKSNKFICYIKNNYPNFPLLPIVKIGEIITKKEILNRYT